MGKVKELKVKPSDIIRIEADEKKELARRFGVTINTVNVALRGASRRGNAPLIREAAVNNYRHYIVKA